MRRILLVVILLLTFGIGQWMLLCHRPVSSPALAESAFAAFGGLRSIAAEITWFRADRLQDEGRYVELAQLARTLTLSEPHVPEVWSYAAWNLAYNVSVMMPTYEDRWRWVLSAMRLLRDDGLKYNPDSPEIHRELAWLFQLKLGISIDSAAELYRKRWRAIVDDVASRGAWDELGMEPMRMTAVENRYGITDRGDPLYSAVYWANRGLDRMRGGSPQARTYLREIVRQSCVIYFKTRAGAKKHG